MGDVGDEDGDITILQAGKTKKVLAEMNMGSAVYATACVLFGAARPAELKASLRRRG